MNTTRPPSRLGLAGALLGALLLVAPAMAQSAQVPPSEAVKLALDAVPGAEALGVRLKGDHYVVKLKQGGAVIVVQVDAATGAVSQ